MANTANITTKNQRLVKKKIQPYLVGFENFPDERRTSPGARATLEKL